MTPEELAAYREWLRIMEFKDNAWPCMALTHIDQQAADIERLHLVIDSCHEDLNCKSDKIGELDVCLDEAEKLIRKNADQINSLLAQVAALKKIAITATSRAIYEECQGDCGHVICSPEKHKKDARRRLSEECPEVFG